MATSVSTYGYPTRPSSPSPLSNNPGKSKATLQTGTKGIVVIALLAISSIKLIAVVTLVTLVAFEAFHLIKEFGSEFFDNRDVKELEQKVLFHLPEKLQKHLMPLIDKINDVKPKTLLRRMEMTHDDEKNFLLYIIEHYEPTPEQLKAILCGAHVRLDDGGEAFKKWEAEWSKRKERKSSHPSNAKQYGMQGALIRELLFSKIGESTWFQLEKNPTTLGHVIRHSYNYAWYKINNANQGPYGESYFKDKNPLILKKRSAS